MEVKTSPARAYVYEATRRVADMSPELWPDDYRAAAMFSFDLDGTELWRTKIEANSEFDKPPIRSRGRFGPEVAVPRILDLFDRYDRRCTFYIPGRVMEDNPEIVGRIADAGHEIGHHGYEHINPATMTPDEEEAELKRGLDVFDDVVGERPDGYRSPAADLSDNTLELLAANGFVYESSLLDTDVPFFHTLDDGNRFVEIPFEWSLDDWPFFGFNMYPPLPYQSGISPTGPVFDSWTREFDGIHRRGRCFVLTMHPQLIGRAGRMDALETLLDHIVDTGDTWVTTGDEIAEHWIATH
jgi:peptidoglycan/xylan/chitin deacetylase (PgdA/CDA1 family)